MRLGKCACALCVRIKNEIFFLMAKVQSASKVLFVHPIPWKHRLALLHPIRQSGPFVNGGPYVRAIDQWPH
jgi:hypothetical protein